MTEEEELAAGFETQRSYLHAIAFRVLGSHTDADDAVQEAWLRLARTGGGGIEDLRGWLTTVTGRICLDVLRRRGARAEQPLEISAGMLAREAAGDGRTGPEEEALLADSVGLALYVVMDALTPAERVSFVLHDVFEVPFGTIATILGRSTAATKMLASRARGRIRLGTPTAAADAAAREVNSRGCSLCSPRMRSFGCKVPREPSSCAARARSRPGRRWVRARMRWDIRRSSTVPRASSSRWAGGRS